MKLFLSAAEPSSEAHALELVKAFKKKYPNENVQFFGVGGASLRSVGFRSVMDSSELSVMGFTEVLPRIFFIIKKFYELIHLIRNEKPDAVILLDFPGFHIKLAQKIYYKLGIPLIYYIPPKIWVWKKNRIFKLKKYCDLILSILPFEEEYYKKGGLPFSYVGNPLLDQLPLEKTKKESRNELGIDSDARVIVILLGSRKQEILYHYPIVLEALFLSLESEKGKLSLTPEHPLHVLIPFHFNSDFELIKNKIELYLESHYACHPNRKKIKFIYSTNKTHEALKAADCGLIKSGTSTLEAALLGCPHILFYKTSLISEWIFKIFIRYNKPVGLVNLVLGIKKREKSPFKELLGAKDFSADKLSHEIIDLLSNEKRIKYLKSECERIKNILFTSQSPSENAALQIKELLEKRKYKMSQPMSRCKISSPIFYCLSFIWSLVNKWRRYLFFMKIPAPIVLPSYVVSVGNIQAGGAGKTPFIISCAQNMISDGKKVVILIRGYRSAVEAHGGIIEPFEKISAERFGDEAVLIHQSVPGAWIGVGKKRVKNFNEIQKKMNQKIDYVLLDDGFQNFSIYKNTSIVLLTSLSRLSYFFRDFNSSLRFATHLVWSKGKIRPDVPFGQRLIDLNYSFTIKNNFFENDQIILVSAIAQNNEFYQEVRKKNIPIKKTYFYPDHFSYEDQTFKEMLISHLENNHKVITTEKDWVKLKDLFFNFEKSFIICDLQVKFNYKDFINER